MTRPGFTLEVDERTGPLLVVQGTGVSMRRFGLGTQVAYPADPTPAGDPRADVSAALDRPVDGEPLAARLTPATRLTVVVGGGDLVRPAMVDDLRRVMVEEVLSRAASARVDDVEILVATGLGRRLGQEELVGLLGERVVRSFAPRGALRCHDVTTDAAPLGTVGGHEIRLNPRIAASDLVVNVALRTDARGLGDDQLALGLGDAATIDHLAGLDADPGARAEAAQLVAAAVPVLTLEAAVGNPALQGPLSFVSQREWNWGVRDRAAVAAVRRALSAWPKQATQRIFGDVTARYGLLAVASGSAGAVDDLTRSAWLGDHLVRVPAAAGVLVTSVWGQGNDNTSPAGDPLGAAHDALVGQGESYVGRRPVTDPAVFVGMHPLREQFSTRHDSAAADFFSDVLSATTDPRRIRDEYQDRFADDAWYADLYQNRGAHHPLRVFHRWYATAGAAEAYSAVIWVGARRASAARMGFRAASTLDDALEIAADKVGADPIVTVVHSGAQIALELA
ncbi:MAG TPA: lactate racemase domain-containing protein [Propionibacteriaceae bacterium]|nr:lactate racemase domain-containing protein [Propionibacteriaceae bacterium]